MFDVVSGQEYGSCGQRRGLCSPPEDSALSSGCASGKNYCRGTRVFWGLQGFTIYMLYCNPETLRYRI
jgi:hypothetical protein